MSATQIGTTDSNIETSVVGFDRQNGQYNSVKIKYGTADLSLLPSAYALLPTSPVDYRTEFGSNLKLAAITGEQVQKGTWEFTATYLRPSSSFATTSDTSKSSSVTVRELPLTEAEKASLTAGSNVRTKLGVQVVYEETERASSFSWSQGNILGQCGAITSPGSLSGASANKWLQVEKSVSEAVDGTVQVRQKYQYDDNKWDTTLYG